MQDGWKAIFKASVLILQEFEEQLLDMSFEMMLSQMPILQQRFFIVQMENEETASETDKANWQLAQQKQLDKLMTVTTIPTCLLERL